MKIFVILASVLLSGCVNLTPGEYVGGEDRCVMSTYGSCQLKVVDGYVEPGEGVNLVLHNFEIGGAGWKHPYVTNEM